MSEVFTAKANDNISSVLREIGHISMERDIRPGNTGGGGYTEESFTDVLSVLKD